MEPSHYKKSAAASDRREKPKQKVEDATPSTQARVRKSRYVVLPNIFGDEGDTESTAFLREINHRALHRKAAFKLTRREMDSEVGTFKVLDSVDLNEAALVEMTSEQAKNFARAYPSLRIAEEVYLKPLHSILLTARRLSVRLPRSNIVKRLHLTVCDASSGKPVANADVAVLLDLKGKGIYDRKTDGKGVFETALPAAQKSIPAIIASPLAGYWPGEVVDVKIADGVTHAVVEVVPLNASGDKDAIDVLCSEADPHAGAGVKIAIIDSGASPHNGLNIVSGLNTTGVEDIANFDDNGSGHGPHVAGIVARIAPAAELMIYRVFAEGENGASEIAISKAIRHAVDNGCDLINLSLGQDTEALSISRETRRARQLGVICIAAAGNDGLGPVLYPARSSHMLAVTACGAYNCWPDGARTFRHIADHPARRGNVFFAAFSNIGDKVDFIAPGVGTISWVGNGVKGVMDGTSMACPVVTGQIAALLAGNVNLLGADRNQQRGDDIIKIAFQAARRFGFGDIYEGSGFIRI